MKDDRKPSHTAYERFLSAIRENGMEERIKRGVLVGFSGGPDSMLLLRFLLEYRRHVDFTLAAVHVHHGIRGKNADRDAEFSRRVCEENEVEFILKHVDVPMHAKRMHIGTEEAARNLRYSCFDEIIQGRNDIETVALGHNATDNLETVLFHMMRGCGSSGLCGIAPVRDNFIRPLILLTKEEILAELSREGIDYVFDETNTDTAYTRNYIRNEIFPMLFRLSPSPEVSVQRLCRNLRSDNDYLDGVAMQKVSAIQNGQARCAELSALHPAIFSRVLMIWGRDYGISFSQKQIEAIYDCLKNGGNFSQDLGGDYSFFADRELCFFQNKDHLANPLEKSFSLKLSADRIEPLPRGAFLVSDGKYSDFLPNIYNFSIKEKLGSAIIEGELFIRYRKEGDSYYYGGMTRKLKKLFNDKKIPLRDRETLPILCDNKGIVWVPGFGVRDDGGKDNNTLTAVYFY